MKRLLSILVAIGLTATTSSAVISCSATKKADNSEQVTTKTPIFSSASWVNNYPNKNIADSNKPIYADEINIAGISFNLIKDFNKDNLTITPDTKNENTDPINILSAIVETSYTRITIRLANKGILVPKNQDDKYVISYTDSNNNISLSVVLLVKAPNDNL